jgi:hypothetical protein
MALQADPTASVRYRRPDTREWLRRSLVILLNGLVGATLAAVLVVSVHAAPIASVGTLGLVLGLVMSMLLVLRSYRLFLFFVLRRGNAPGVLCHSDAPDRALRAELFAEFLAERHARLGGRPGVLGALPVAVLKLLVASRAPATEDKIARSARP